MATPLTASKLIAALRNEGLVVHEVRDWRTHNRNAKGPWGPVNGVMIHHTVTKGTDSSVDLCHDGLLRPARPAVPRRHRPRTARSTSSATAAPTTPVSATTTSCAR